MHLLLGSLLWESLHDSLSRLLDMPTRELFGLSLIAAQHSIQNMSMFVPYTIAIMRRFDHSNHCATEVMPIQTQCLGEQWISGSLIDPHVKCHVCACEGCNRSLLNSGTSVFKHCVSALARELDIVSGSELETALCPSGKRA